MDARLRLHALILSAICSLPSTVRAVQPELREVHLDEATPDARGDAGLATAFAGAVVVDPDFAPEGESLDDRRATPGWAREEQSFWSSLRWVPRSLLLPFHAALGSVVRPATNQAIATFLPTDAAAAVRTESGRQADPFQLRLRPVLNFETRRRPGVGALAFAAYEPTSTRGLLEFETDFDENFGTRAALRQPLARELMAVQARGRWLRVDDVPVFGRGAGADAADEVRLRHTAAGAELAATFAPDEHVEFQLAGGAERHEFGCSDSPAAPDVCGSDDVLGSDDVEVVDRSLFVRGYRLGTASTRIGLDSRETGATTGARLDLSGTVHAPIVNPRPATFVTAGGQLRGVVDMGHGTVGTVALRSEVAETLSASEPTNLPIVELPSLGGEDGLRGFVEGRLRGRVLALASLQYRYPIWSYCDALLFAEVGNADRSVAATLRARALRGTGGVELQFGGGDYTTKVALAVGTSRFGAADFGLESARLALRTQWML